MPTEFLPVGFGNVLAVNRVIAVASPDSEPIRRLIQDARARNSAVDLTRGRKTKAVAILDSGHLVLLALTPDTIANRLAGLRRGQP